MNIKLIDTFNKVEISTHRTLEAAVKAQRKHLAAVKRRNGQNSYLTYAFRYSDGTAVDEWEVQQVKHDLDRLEYCR